MIHLCYLGGNNIRIHIFYGVVAMMMMMASSDLCCNGLAGPTIKRSLCRMGTFIIQNEQ